MTIKTKVMKISDIKIDKETYPRSHIDWVTRARYIKAMQTGDKFPLIVVAKVRRTYYLVDGAHRIDAMKALKVKNTQVDVLEGLDKRAIFIEAVKRNIGHGRQFSTQEVTDICITLEKWNLSSKAISVIIRMPANQIKPFVARRMTRLSEGGGKFALKAPLKNWAGINLEEMPDQSGFTAGSQMSMINNLIALLNQNLINSKDKKIMSRLERLYKLLTPMFA